MNLQEKIEQQIELYNEGDMDAHNCILCLVKQADEVIEDQPRFIHYRIGEQEYEIVWHQDRHGNVSATVDKYKVDE